MQVRARAVRLSAIILLAAFLAGALSPAAELPGRRFALLVGVREYDPNELRKLPYAEADVVALGDILDKSGFRRVVTLTQTAGARQFKFLPTAANIRKSLAGILADRTENDLVLIAFAAHGVQFKGEKQSYFCPMDATLNDRKTPVSLAEVYAVMKASKAGSKLLLVDACRNDPQSDNSRSKAEVKLESITLPQLTAPPGGVAALFSCSAGQKAYEHDRLKHGVFFHTVIEALGGKADFRRRGQVTWDELVVYTKLEVPGKR